MTSTRGHESTDRAMGARGLGERCGASEFVRHWNLDPSIAFLNHGSFGATPKPVFDTYQGWQRTPVALACHSRLERQMFRLRQVAH